jgi:hypothetical protein
MSFNETSAPLLKLVFWKYKKGMKSRLDPFFIFLMFVISRGVGYTMFPEERLRTFANASV